MASERPNPPEAKRRRPARGSHLRRTRRKEATAQFVDTRADELLAAARSAAGFAAPSAAPEPFLAGMAESQAGVGVLATLGAFVVVDQILAFVLSALGPEIRATLGLSVAAYGNIVAQRANAAQDAIEAIHKAVALPIDEILSDACALAERFLSAEPEVAARLRRIVWTSWLDFSQTPRI